MGTTQMSARRKYEFTGETKDHYGITLHRIRALIDFCGVKAGDEGGWVALERHLPHEGDAWVFGNARVYGDAQVLGNARVYGDAWVFGNAQVFGNARVYGDAQVSGDAWVFGNARVSGNARVFGDAQVFGNARVSGDAWVFGNARVFGDAQVFGNARVYGGTIALATRSDGYSFCVFATDAGYALTAGCRFFTSFEAAREHWRTTRGGTQLGDESLAIVDHLERIAAIRGITAAAKSEAS